MGLDLQLGELCSILNRTLDIIGPPARLWVQPLARAWSIGDIVSLFE